MKMNTSVIESDTPLIKTKAHRDTLRSMLADLSAGKIAEFVEEFGSHFTFTDPALGLLFTEKWRLIEFLQKSRELFPDVKIEVVSTFDSGNYAVAEWTVTATETTQAYGSMQVRLPISFSGISIAQFRNEKIVRWIDYYDKVQSRRVGLAGYFTDWVEL